MPPATAYPPGPVVSPPGVDVVVWVEYFLARWIEWYPPLLSGARGLVGLIVGLAFPLSLMFLIGIIYCVEQLKHIRRKEAEIYDTKVIPAYDIVQNGDPALAQRWQTVMKHIESASANDWKQAIIESDIILGDILTKMGYHGDSIGEKLKRIEASDFQTLNEAWEAHKIRNRIAHDGSEFTMSQHEARQVINNYRKVFEEFYYI